MSHLTTEELGMLDVVGSDIERRMVAEIRRRRLSPEHVAALFAFASSSHAATYHPFTVDAVRAVLATQELP